MNHSTMNSVLPSDVHTQIVPRVLAASFTTKGDSLCILSPALGQHGLQSSERRRRLGLDQSAPAELGSGGAFQAGAPWKWCRPEVLGWALSLLGVLAGGAEGGTHRVSLLEGYSASLVILIKSWWGGCFETI